MVRTTTDNTELALDGFLAILGLFAVVIGLAWVIMNPGSFMILPFDLLGVLLVAGGALLLVSGLFGQLGSEKMMGTLWTLLVVVSAIVAVIVTAALAVF